MGCETTHVTLRSKQFTIKTHEKPITHNDKLIIDFSTNNIHRKRRLISLKKQKIKIYTFLIPMITTQVSHISHERILHVHVLISWNRGNEIKWHKSQYFL